MHSWSGRSFELSDEPQAEEEKEGDEGGDDGRESGKAEDGPQGRWVDEEAQQLWVPPPPQPGQPPQTMMLPNFAPQLLAMAYNRQGVTSLLNYLNQEDTVQVGPTL